MCRFHSFLVFFFNDYHFFQERPCLILHELYVPDCSFNFCLCSSINHISCLVMLRFLVQTYFKHGCIYVQTYMKHDHIQIIIYTQPAMCECSNPRPGLVLCVVFKDIQQKVCEPVKQSILSSTIVQLCDTIFKHYRISGNFAMI